jgi:K+-sensing histidine kinase KdpD
VRTGQDLADRRRLSSRTRRGLAWAAAVAGPAILTAGLRHVGGQERDYVFIYLGLVAVLGVLSGLWPSMAAAAWSFLLVDYFFIPPVGALSIAGAQDAVNLLAFAVTAGLVGVLASLRRRAQLRAEALANQLRHANTDLVRANKEQAQSAQAALRLARTQEQVRALQEADRLRRDLLANVSHELRTPLGTILTESTSALPEAAAIEEAGRRMHTIAEEARRLRALVNDMLDMSVIESGTLELQLEPLQVGDAIEAAVERLHRTSPERVVSWDQGGVEVLADWHRLGQILDNLLANADRFAPEGTPIRISVRREQGGLVSIAVSDEGPGVAPELRSHVFDRFVRGQAEAGPGQPVGTGLGLSIVRGLVEAHAGSIELEDPDGRPGATFRLTLPGVEEAG